MKNKEVKLKSNDIYIILTQRPRMKGKTTGVYSVPEQKVNAKKTIQGGWWPMRGRFFFVTYVYKCER